MYVEPFAGVSIYDANDPEYSDLLARAAAVCTTEALMRAEGVHYDDPESTIEDLHTAKTVVEAYAKDPVATSKEVRLENLPTPSMLMAANILKEFGASVVASAKDIRALVTTKLVLETENADPKIRIRALELLGKMTDVGLFTERKQVTVVNQSPEEVASKLREKLGKLRTLVQNADGSYEEVPTELKEPEPLNATQALAELLR
jgi:hypothetical protein